MDEEKDDLKSVKVCKFNNPVRELSKTMDAPVPVHLKEMYKVIRHVLSTKRYGLKFELRKDMIKWALRALSDSTLPVTKKPG